MHVLLKERCASHEYEDATKRMWQAGLSWLTDTVKLGMHWEMIRTLMRCKISALHAACLALLAYKNSRMLAHEILGETELLSIDDYCIAVTCMRYMHRSESTCSLHDTDMAHH